MRVKGRNRVQGEATVAAARKIWVLLELLRSKSVRFSAYERVYGEGYRTFQRDLQHLRHIGATNGFGISKISERERAELTHVDMKLRSLDESAHVLEFLGALASSLGAPVASELGELAKTKDDGGFLRFVVPQLLEQSHVAKTYQHLKAAWQTRPNPASVRFKYASGPKKGEERHVEPYRVLLRSGSAYLVAYDLDRKDWRIFALDRMMTLPAKAGTIPKVRDVPAQFDATDAVGFMKSHEAPIAVTVRLSAKVAASATSRRWQALQRFVSFDDGSAEMTFVVGDPHEVVRWAMGYGGEAAVIAPDHVVSLALHTAQTILESYRGRKLSHT